MRPAGLLALALALGLSAAQAAAQASLSGSVAAEARRFPHAPAFPGQSGDALLLSMTLDARFVYAWNDGADRVVVAPFLRFGGDGDGRNHDDLREAYWRHLGDGWSLTAGLDKVFWGVAESRHLVDIINQDDLLEDLDGEDKLGQPMLNLSLHGDYGTFDVFLLPSFREREFLGFGPRLGGPVPVRPATYEAAAGRSHLDYALRWSQSAGNWDLGLSWFAGTSREPTLVPTFRGLLPHYEQIAQAGLDVQYTSGAWLWKLEAIRRSGHGPDFWAATGGFEWTLSGVLGSGADLGVIAEYSHDGRDPERAPPVLYDDDLFLGARLALNDVAGSSLLVGALFDRGTDERLVVVEGQRRLGGGWQVSLEGRFFQGTAPAIPLSAVIEDDFLSLTLRRHF